MTEEEAEVLLYEWRIWARDKQIPPQGEWYIWLIRSGRGFGKTWTGANWIIENAMLDPRYPLGLVGQTKADVRDTMVELGESGILALCPPWFQADYQPSKRRIVFPNGAKCILYSGDEPGQLRGPQHAKVWIDELAKFKYPKETMDNVELGCRLGDNPQICITSTPRPIPIIKEIMEDPQTVDVVGSTYENYQNLAPQFINRIVKKYEGTRLGRQELHGDVLGDTPGALWTRLLIDTITGKFLPGELFRVVVAIDPAVSANEESSNETGIIVAGLCKTELSSTVGVVLADYSGIYTPNEWARKAVSAYDEFKADRIVAEINQGGDMVENTIKTINGKVSYKGVRATKGKYTRAEPIAALYEQKKIFHFGSFAELEDQMCTWIPGEDSPDRLDAMVWAFTELMLEAPAQASQHKNPFFG